MKTKLNLLTLFAVSALMVIIWYGTKTTDLDDAQDTLPFGEFGDPKSVSLRGQRVNTVVTDVQTDASHPKVSY
eukprot:scaffold7340_cov108-Skeletonema_menzelii.AAC.3